MVSARFVSVYDTELRLMQKQVVSGSQGAFVMCVALVGSVSKQTIKLNVRLIYEKLTEISVGISISLVSVVCAGQQFIIIIIIFSSTNVKFRQIKSWLYVGYKNANNNVAEKRRLKD